MNCSVVEDRVRAVLRGIEDFAREIFPEDEKVAQIASKVIKGLAVTLLSFSICLGAIALGAYVGSLASGVPFKQGFSKLTGTIVQMFVVTVIKGQIISFSSEL